MEVKAEFKNGACSLQLTPSDQWEKLLLGSVAKGEQALSAVVTYESDGHFSYGRCEAVHVLLEAGSAGMDVPCAGCSFYLKRQCVAEVQWKDFSCRSPAVGAA